MSDTDADTGLPPLEFHRRAQDVFAAVLVGVRADQLELPTPCDGWDVRALIDHVILGNERVQQRAGRTPAPLPDDLVAADAASAAGAQAVFAAPDGLVRIFELPIGDLPGEGFLAIRSGDAVTHAWDLAVATGQPTNLDPTVAAQALASARRFMANHGDSPSTKWCGASRCGKPPIAENWSRRRRSASRRIARYVLP